MTGKQSKEKKPGKNQKFGYFNPNGFNWNSNQKKKKNNNRKNVWKMLDRKEIIKQVIFVSNLVPINCSSFYYLKSNQHSYVKIFPCINKYKNNIHQSAKKIMHNGQWNRGKKSRDRLFFRRRTTDNGFFSYLEIVCWPDFRLGHKHKNK